MPRKRRTPKEPQVPAASQGAGSSSAPASPPAAATRPTPTGTQPQSQQARSTGPPATTTTPAPGLSAAAAAAAASAAAFQSSLAPPLPEKRVSPQRSGAQGSSGSGSPSERSAAIQAQLEEAVPPQGSEIGHIEIPSQCRRPDGGGTLGSRVQVVSNYYLVNVKDRDVYQYDVRIDEIKTSKSKGKDGVEEETQQVKDLPPRLCRAILKKLGEDAGWDRSQWAYDGKKTLYFARRGIVPQHECSTEMVLESDTGRAKRFVVITKETAVVSLKPLLKENLVRETAAILQDRPAFQAAEIILKHTAAMYRDFLMSGNARAFFIKPLQLGPQQQPFPGGSELWTGFRQSLRPTAGGLALNLDVATGAFVKEQLAVSYMVEALGKRGVGDVISSMTRNATGTKKALKDAFYGMKVKATHNSMTYTINDVLKTGAATEKVPGERETIQKYFEQRYNLRLQHPNAPLLVAGSAKNPKYLPPELLMIKKGNRVTKLSDQQTAMMPRLASLKPHIRFATIDRDIVPMCGLATDPTASAFGLTMGKNRCEPIGRVLPSPQLLVRKADTGNPVIMSVTPEGKWKDDRLNFKYIKGGTITSYGVAAFDDHADEGTLRGFIQALMDFLGRRGVVLPQAGIPTIAWYEGDQRWPDQDHVTATLEQAVENAKRTFKAPPHIIFALLPRKNSFYREVKMASDSVLGIISQCFLPKALGGGRGGGGGGRGRGRGGGGGGGGFDTAYLENLCLKVNAKVGGVNQDVALDSQEDVKTMCKRIRAETLFLGADVTHPGPRSPDPSIAAVVASTNATATRFAAKVLAQGQRVENIQGMKQAVLELLSVRKRLNPGSALPKRIVMYRDGVSEGQFEMVRDKEYRAIRAACDEVPEYRPFITIIAVQKRHLTSLGAQLQNSLDNVKPGTVVDKLVVHPVDFDFFMASQYGLQGTTRAAKYTVIVNENQDVFRSDAVQLLTYRLSYLFCRCRTPVSLPPPAYYAHLAAARGKMLLFTKDTGRSEASTSVSDIEMATVHDALESEMFFV